MGKPNRESNYVCQHNFYNCFTSDRWDLPLQNAIKSSFFFFFFHFTVFNLFRSQTHPPPPPPPPNFPSPSLLQPDISALSHPSSSSSSARISNYKQVDIYPLASFFFLSCISLYFLHFLVRSVSTSFILQQPFHSPNLLQPELII